jgi:hypothetical protein
MILVESFVRRPHSYRPDDKPEHPGMVSGHDCCCLLTGIRARPAPHKKSFKKDRRSQVIGIYLREEIVQFFPKERSTWVKWSRNKP